APEAMAAEDQLLADGVEDPWMHVAALSASSTRALKYFELAVSRFIDTETTGRRNFFHQVSSVIGMRASREEMRRVLTTVAGRSRRNADWWGGGTVAGGGDGVGEER